MYLILILVFMFMVFNLVTIWLALVLITGLMSCHRLRQFSALALPLLSLGHYTKLTLYLSCLGRARGSKETWSRYSLSCLQPVLMRTTLDCITSCAKAFELWRCGCAGRYWVQTSRDEMTGTCQYLRVISAHGTKQCPVDDMLKRCR